MTKKKEIILHLDNLKKADRLEDRMRTSVSEEMLLRGYLFEEESVTDPEMDHADVDTVHFLRCRFESVNFEKSSFINVRFSNCDLSNCTFKSAYFKDVIFENCKGIGTQFIQASLKNTAFCNSNMDYSNFGQTRLENCCFLTSQFNSASISEAMIKSLHISGCKFHSTDFFHTPLGGIDFSDSDLENLLLSDDLSEVRDSKMNLFQAATIAKMLGIQIL